MLVLPLPGGPKRNSPRPELMAGPSRSSMLLVQQQAVEGAAQVFGRGMLARSATGRWTLAM